MSVVSYTSFTSDVLPMDQQFMGMGGMPMMQQGMPMQDMGMYSTGVQNGLYSSGAMGGGGYGGSPFGGGNFNPSTSMTKPKNSVQSSPYLTNSFMYGAPSGSNEKSLPSIKDNYTTGLKLQEISSQFGRQLQVVRLTPGSSAANSGMITSGDTLSRVDNYMLDGGSYDTMTVRQMLAGLKGSAVSLALKKPNGVPYEVTLVRNVRSVKKGLDSALNKAVAWMTEVGSTLQGSPLMVGASARGFAPKNHQPYGGYVMPSAPLPADEYGRYSGIGGTTMMPTMAAQPLQQTMFSQPTYIQPQMTMQQPMMQMQQPMMSMQQPLPQVMNTGFMPMGMAPQTSMQTFPMQGGFMGAPMIGGFGGFGGGYMGAPMMGGSMPQFGGYQVVNGGMGGGRMQDSMTPSMVLGDGVGYEDM